MNEKITKTVLVCGNPNALSKMFIKDLMDEFRVFFISYSVSIHYEKLKEILGDNIFINKLDFVHNIIVWFFLCVSICKKENVDFFIAYTDNPIPNGLCMLFVRLFYPNVTRIFFPYDIVQYAVVREYKYTIKSRLFYFFDRICFEHAQGFITKGYNDDLKYISGIYKIFDKPHFVYNCVMDKNDVVIKKSKELDVSNIHFVYIGNIETSEYSMSNYKVYDELLKNNNIVIHIYSFKSHLLDKLVSKYDNIIIHDYIHDHKELIDEISQYDFGLAVAKPSRFEWLQSMMASGLKIFVYLSACLPVVVDKDHVYASDFVCQNNFGIVVSTDSLDDLFDYIIQCDYNDLVESVSRNRERYYSDNNKLISFLEEV